MSEAKFTKGEWYIDDAWVACDGSPVCAMGDSWVSYDNSKKNAHLIAAAPEMYAMLQRWVDSYECVDDNYQDGVNSDTIDLLAKARGE